MNSIVKAMKKIFLALAGASMLLQVQAGLIPGISVDKQKTPSGKGSLTINTTPDLYDLVTYWTGEYSVINPKLKIRVVSQEGLQSGTLKEPGANLSIVSNELINAPDRESQWKMVIGRDAIIPVINSANPLLNEIVIQGVSAREMARLMNNTGAASWATALEGGKDIPANVYMIEDPSIKSTVAGFLNLTPASLHGKMVADGKVLIAAIQKDPNGIGFCKLADITGDSDQNLVEGISLLPIDRNGNGKMDYIEKIYNNVNDLSRGIWIGKYPDALCRNLYASSAAKPVNENEIAFLRYILTTGQQYLDIIGFNSLSNTERLSKIDRLPSSFLSAQTSNGINLTQLIVTILAGLAILLALMFMILRYRKVNLHAIKNIDPEHVHAINEGSLVTPRGLFFDKTHTWAFMEKSGEVKVGIDDFLQHVTGKITSIKLKKPGDKVKKGEPVLTIVQNGKRLNISSPLSGMIITENPVLFTDPSLLNSAPFAEGWIYLMEPTNWLRENQFLFMVEKYSEWIKGEFSRLKDFLASAIKTNDPQYAYVILQDGGEITDHLLENLGPEIWEDFQTNFIDTSK